MSNSNSSGGKTLDQEVEEVLGAVDGTDPVNDAGVDPVPEVQVVPSPKAQMELKVAAVIPMHQVPGIPAHRGRGRPKKIETKPTPDALAYHAEMTRQQIEYVDNDAIVQATNMRKDSAEMLHLVRARLARVQASLEFRRLEDEKRGGREAAQILSRQTAVLREIAQIELKIKEMGVQMLDLHGEPMQKVFAMFVERIQRVASEVLPKAQFDLFFNRLETALEGWEEEAESLIR